MNTSQKAIIIVLIVIVGTAFIYTTLKSFVEETIFPEEVVKQARDGEVKHYSSSGTLKTVINYDQGVKHGMSYQFYQDGKTVLLAMPYLHGKREGVSKKYYKSGKLYAETSYQNDELNGPRKTYYQSGQLKSEVLFLNGNPGTGTTEYFTSGEPKTAYSIRTEKRGRNILLSVEPACKDALFYVGKLISDRFYDEYSEDLKVLPERSGQSYINIDIFTPSFLRYQDIICSCKSSQGNPVILKDRLDI